MAFRLPIRALNRLIPTTVKPARMLSPQILSMVSSNFHRIISDANVDFFDSTVVGVFTKMPVSKLCTPGPRPSTQRPWTFSTGTSTTASRSIASWMARAVS